MFSDDALKSVSGNRIERIEEPLSFQDECENEDYVIEFKNVTKTYKLYKNERGRFLGLLNHSARGSLVAVTNACDNMSFKIRRGEAVALLGRNGAGKSTTLKMITGVIHPTLGEVVVNGRVSALLELTTGFDSKLTGRENIALRGQILGLSQKQISIIEPQVIEFAELGAYIDQPLRTYSSGMRSRLGFAFAVSVEPEILVVDEALSVGDQAFQRKCINRIREIMMDGNVTVLFVTHASAIAKEFCERGLVLDHGRLVYDGGILEATRFYSEKYLFNIQARTIKPSIKTMTVAHDYIVKQPNMLQDTDVIGLQKKDAPYGRYRTVPNSNFSTSFFNFAKHNNLPPEEGIKNAFQWSIKSGAGFVYKAYLFYSTACLELHEGAEYTLGCWVYCSVDDGTKAALQLYAGLGEYSASRNLGRLYFALSSGWQYISATFVCTETRTNYGAYFGCLSRGADAIQRMCGFALVEGSAAYAADD